MIKRHFLNRSILRGIEIKNVCKIVNIKRRKFVISMKELGL